MTKAKDDDGAASTDSNEENGRRRRDGRDGREEEEEERRDRVAAASRDPRGSLCPHVGKAVSLPGLKKSLKVAWCRIGQCGPCVKDRSAGIRGGAAAADGAKGKKVGAKAANAATPAAPAAAPAKPVDPSRPIGVWLCLRCGLQLCDSNSTANHCKAHFVVPRSDLHCIVVDTDSWKIWCNECADEIYVDSYKKLREAVDFVTRVEQTKGRAAAPTGASAAYATGGTASAKTKGVPATKGGAASAATSLVPKARGLSNLGNTCFFNSVMQALSQSRPLTHLLERHCQKGAALSLPAVQITPSTSAKSPKQPETLDPLAVQLMESGGLTMALAAFVKDMNTSGKSGVVNPGHLFGQISKRSPQFRGMHQQDSHELLRQLTEGLRAEEVTRQKKAILKHFGLSEKTDPKSVNPETKRKLQALGRHSNYTIVDKIFGGHLVSTIVCEQCHNSSQIYEPYLDLSLPLVEEKPQRGKKSKAVAAVEEDVEIGEDDSNKQQSRGSTKKERAKSKKEKRRARKNRRRGITDADEEEQEDAQVADNKDDEDGGKVDSEADDGEGGEEAKMLKELEENEKGELRESPEKNNGDSKYETAESVDGANNLAPEEQIDEEADPAPVEEDKDAESTEKSSAALLKANGVKSKSSVFERASKKDATVAAAKDGNEEDDEDGYSEENEGDDWEWDYGEQWDEGDEEADGADVDKGEQEELEPLIKKEAADEEEKPDSETKPLVSLNPLPPERLQRGSSERSDDVQDEGKSLSNSSDESETGASINGDVEDNLEESTSNVPSKFYPDALRNLEPFHPDPDHLDPHMEELCRKVRKMSVATSQPQQEGFAAAAGGDDDDDDEEADGEEEKKDYVIGIEQQQQQQSEDAVHQRLQNDWVARSLTSIGPRYQSRAGECSVYSCLTQFTAPELLTGNNKWACDRCSKIQAEKKRRSEVRISSSEPEGGGSSNGQVKNSASESDVADEKAAAAEAPKKSAKPPTVYSNASKQLLIFSPPAVLTIHLKRFQQTVFNLRKVNRHVEFPLELNLAPFCASTSLSAPNVSAGVKDILYSLYAVVEHSGRLQNGHYTAYVRMTQRAQQEQQLPDFSKFYSSPASKSEEVHSLLAEIERKCREKVAETMADPESDASQPDSSPPLQTKWYHVSDSHVMESSVEKVLKCQAYLLFYERTL